MATPGDFARQLRPAVTEWTGEHLRDLPWRRTRDPWAILVAETMLQQTQVARVAERWSAFLGSFPDAPSCAAGRVGEVVRAWEGLGYNRRAISLHAAAARIVARHDGEVPSVLADLLDLPGVGPYTARAVLAFAFEEPAAVVDTNVGRVLARLLGRPLAIREAQEIADGLAPDDMSWRWNQGIIELGALVCTKRTPGCDACPVRSACEWRGSGPDPAVGSAAVGTGQSRFEGSDRQLRGRLVAALRTGPVPRGDLVPTVGAGSGITPDRVDGVVAGLVRDGLAVIRGDRLELP